MAATATATATATGTETKLSVYVTDEELKGYLQRSDANAFWMTACNVAIVALAFALPAIWFNPATLVLSVLLLGGRQLGFAVLYHDCAHSVFFKTKQLNELLGHWMFGGLMNTSLASYRNYHLGHHRFAGTTDDPDLEMANAYPATKASMRRKVIRDATGQTGFKTIKAQVSAFRWKRNAPFLVSHAVMLGLLTLFGIAWTYLLWWVAYLVVYQVITRIRFMSEHAVALDRLSDDPRDNTCTTVISWWERLFVGPNFVNYHLEHHLRAAIPCYNLRRFHELLKARDYYGDKACFSYGYANVLRKATQPA